MTPITPNELLEAIAPMLMYVLPLAVVPMVVFGGMKAFKLFLELGYPGDYSKKELAQMERVEAAKKEIELKQLRDAESAKAARTLEPPKKIKEDQEQSRCDCVLCQPDLYAMRQVGLTPPKPSASMRTYRRYWDGMIEKRR